MSAISKINKSNLDENERIRLKTLIIEKPDIRAQIEEDDQVNDKLQLNDEFYNKFNVPKPTLNKD